MRFLLPLLLALGAPAGAAPWAPQRPKLVVVLVIDQFRADYLARFRDQFQKDGFRGLIDQGAYFPYAEYDILQAMTAPGHATILTGAYPYQFGIPVNEWFDQSARAVRESVQDPSAHLIGPGLENFDGASPRHLVGPTLGDELKNADWPSQVVSVALKPRAAVLMGGHRADLSFWYDARATRWTTSTYYRPDKTLPKWMDALNEKARPCALGEACGVEITVDAAEAALKGMKLGQGPGPDVLAVSFSSHDVAGHAFGPNDDRMRELTLAEDRALARLRRSVAALVPGGLARVTFALTGDHGVAPSPAYVAKTPLEGGLVDEVKLLKEINAALDQRFGAKVKPWVAHLMAFNFFLDETALAQAKLDPAQVAAEIKAVLMKNPAFARVITRDEFNSGVRWPGTFATRLERTYYAGRSGHVIAIPKPYFIGGRAAANHMTSYVYDRTVPLVLSGFGIRNIVSRRTVGVVDLAPTLAYLMRTLPPALSEGNVLAEALKP